MVVLMGEARDEQRQRDLPIVRSDSGHFRGFGDLVSLSHDGMKGRFAELLPAKPKDESKKQMSLELLDSMDVRVEWI